jgi:hypothetical protein
MCAAACGESQGEEITHFIYGEAPRCQPHFILNHLFHGGECVSEEMRKNMGKTIAEKLEVISEEVKNKRSKSEIAQAYGITLSTLSSY